jgi:hypothetical protein
MLGIAALAGFAAKPPAINEQIVRKATENLFLFKIPPCSFLRPRSTVEVCSVAKIVGYEYYFV